MNAPTRAPQSRPQVTQTFFPPPRWVPAAAAPPGVRPRPGEEGQDDEHAPEEPGYGHGV